MAYGYVALWTALLRTAQPTLEMFTDHVIWNRQSFGEASYHQ